MCGGGGVIVGWDACLSFCFGSQEAAGSRERSEERAESRDESSLQEKISALPGGREEGGGSKRLQQSLHRANLEDLLPYPGLNECFSFTIRTPRTRAAFGLSEGSCRSPASCRRSSTLKPIPRTLASTCCGPSKASALARRRAPGDTAAEVLLRQAGGKPVRSCDQYVVAGTIGTPPCERDLSIISVTGATGPHLRIISDADRVLMSLVGGG